jgi:nucleoside-diphosphate-sugar epimerase
MSQVLVLGGGWVGSAIAARAAERGEVSVIDPPLDPGYASRDLAATRRLAQLVGETGVRVVVNACGRVGGDEAELTDANVDFVHWLCDALVDTGVRLVHIGSASEYGDPGSAAPVDERTPARPVGPYATTKARGTEVALAAGAAGLDAVVARVFNLVGPTIPAASPLREWFDRLVELGPAGGEVDVWWPPTTRDFVELDDAARALLDLGDTPSAPPLVNVCSGTGLAFGDIVTALAAQLAVPATVRSLDRPGIGAVVGDPTLLEHSIGWSPAMTLERLAQVVARGVGPG